jgi:hypothetical protein
MGKDAFIEALSALREECGRPPYKKLNDISKGLTQRDPAFPGGGPRLPELSKTALSEILTGKRRGLPSADWVASFVLSCQRYAAMVGISPDPGRATLPGWQARLRGAQADAGGKARNGYAATSPLPVLVSVSLPPRHQVFVADHAPYGSRLLASVEAGHPDAIYRVAMLLGTDRKRSDDALSLLVQLAAAGHQPSIDLLDDDPSGGLPPDLVAMRAYDLADAAEAAGRIDEARAFYKTAARGGVPEARLKHASGVLERRGEPQAAAWLSAMTSAPGNAGPEDAGPGGTVPGGAGPGGAGPGGTASADPADEQDS